MKVFQNPCQKSTPLRVPRPHLRAPVRTLCTKQQVPKRTALPVPPPLKAAFQRLGQTAAGLAAAGLLFLAYPAGATETLTFRVAETPDLFSVQRTLVEAWTIITESFVDPAFNNVDWKSELAARLDDVSAAPSTGEATKVITSMVGKLGDPFTRWVPPEEYRQFRVSSDGELQGVGLLIASDPSSGALVVLAPIKGSPAERAGIQPGDQVVKVDGTDVAGWDGDRAAKVLRGEQGSSVLVEVARRKGGSSSSSNVMSVTNGKVEVPGVPGARSLEPEPLEHKRFRLRRERVELSPVFATAVHYDDHAYGYVRLVNFSAHAATEMADAIAQLRRDGAEAFILDLRNNPGGLVRSSLDIAGLWLDPRAHPTVFRVQDRGDGGDDAHLSPASANRVVLSGASGAATDAPLVVLVNKQSASASEILAGALKDNGRAEIIGVPTFGKGKIQSVFELGDGSAVFVTVAKYVTPAGAEIDKVGVVPDRACSPMRPGGPASVPGIPVGPGADALVLEELSSDECVLTAEALLEARMERAPHV